MFLSHLIHLYPGMETSDSPMSSHNHVSVMHTTSGFSMSQRACSSSCLGHKLLALKYSMCKCLSGWTPRMACFSANLGTKKNSHCAVMFPHCWARVLVCDSVPISRMSGFVYSPTVVPAVAVTISWPRTRNYHWTELFFFFLNLRCTSTLSATVDSLWSAVKTVLL